MSRQTQNLSPCVTVVIPVHNYAAYVVDAIQSAATQGEAVQEIIVVDDGSTDGTGEAIRDLKEPRLRLLRQANAGPSAARNTGWRAARADWIQFLDADDMLEPGATRALLSAGLAHPGRLPYGIQTVYPLDMRSGPSLTGQLAARSGRLLDELCVYYYASIFTALLPRAALAAVGGFTDAFRYYEDYDLAMRLAERFEFEYVRQPVYRTRMHGDNRHRGFGAAASEQRLEVIRRNLGGRQEWAARRRFRRALAQAYWRSGLEARQAGEGHLARGFFWHAILHQPTKLGAWRGWLDSFRSSRLRLAT